MNKSKNISNVINTSKKCEELGDMSAHSDVRAAALLRERPLFGAVPFPSFDCSLIALNSSTTCSTQYIHTYVTRIQKFIRVTTRRKIAKS